MFRRTLAAGLALALTAGAGPAFALPKPRADQWWLSPMGVSEAWKHSTGRGVTIALIDSQPNLGLPQFEGADVRQGREFYEGKDEHPEHPRARNHGTSMLAAIVAQRGYVGVAPDATVISVPYGLVRGISDAIRYSVDQGADIISMSFGYVGIVMHEIRCSEGVQESIDYALERDVVLVASLGNNRSDAQVDSFPAMCPGVLAVGGLSKSLKPRKKAKRTYYTAAAAPSEDVFGTGYDGSEYKGDGGTSVAAAFTSASLALIRSAHPTESGRQAVSRLLYAAQDVHTPGYDDTTGHGLIRPDKAITTSVPAGFANTVYDRHDAFLKKEAEHQQLVDTPPPFTVGGDPADRKEITSTWETLTPWFAGGALLTLAAALAGIFAFRRKRSRQQ